MRIIVAAILGTIVVFVWGAVSWTVLDLWGDEIRELPASEALVSEIGSTIDEPGAYVFPPMPDPPPDASEEERAALMQAWTEASNEGPAGVLLVRPNGVEPMNPSMFIVGFLLEFGGALLISLVLAIAAQAGLGRAGRIVIGIGLVGFAVIAGVLVPGNFMILPADWVKAMAGDLAIGWSLAVVVIAFVVKSRSGGGRHARI